MKYHYKNSKTQQNISTYIYGYSIRDRTDDIIQYPPKMITMINTNQNRYKLENYRLATSTNIEIVLPKSLYIYIPIQMTLCGLHIRIRHWVWRSMVNNIWIYQETHSVDIWVYPVGQGSSGKVHQPKGIAYKLGPWVNIANPTLGFPEACELILLYPTIRYQYQPYSINTFYLIYYTPLMITLWI